MKLTLLESLKEGECIIIMDWKMKFLPQKHRESMQEYFGKAGITWHGIYLLFKRNGVYTTKFYNDVGDDKEEDGFAVWSSFVETCKIIKGEFPHICSCYVLSDGAGCYSGAYLAINLAVVGSITGIFVLAHYIAESGRGKSCLDANFGVLMKHVKKVVNANLKDITGI